MTKQKLGRVLENRLLKKIKITNSILFVENYIFGKKMFAPMASKIVCMCDIQNLQVLRLKSNFWHLT